MKNKGFTLIELLAVIVILAIIALIATPIILNIIDDTKEESVKRSIDHYMSAVTTAIARANLNNVSNGVNPSECTTTEEGLSCAGTPIPVEVDGDKPKTGGTITFENGKITYINITMPDGNTYGFDDKGNIVKTGEGSVPGTGDGESGTPYTGTIYRNSADLLFKNESVDTHIRWCAEIPTFGTTCTVNDGGINFMSDSKEMCESSLAENDDEILEYVDASSLANAKCVQKEISISYETSLSNISQNYYLKHEVTNNVVTASSACITYTENGTRKDVCLRGGSPSYYESNKIILQGIEEYVKTMTYDSSPNGYGYCEGRGTTSYYCYTDDFKVSIFSNGGVTTYGSMGEDGKINRCIVDVIGLSYCYE